MLFVTFFRKDILEAATKFERWDFLKCHFNKRKEKKLWHAAKLRAEEAEKEKEHPNTELKLFRLSRQFPMFNDAAIPSFAMKDDAVVENSDGTR